MLIPNINLATESCETKFLMKNTLTLITCLIFLNSGSLYAQNYVDLLQAFYSNTPLNQFDSSLNKTRVQDFGLAFTLPIIINPKNTLVTGMEMERMSASLTPAGTSGSVASILLRLGINKQLNEKWNGTVLLLPKLASDFQKTANTTAIVPEDFQIGTFIMFKYIKNPNYKYKIGLYANTDLFGPMFSPMLGLYYKSENKKFEADITLPFLADLNYRVMEKAQAGLRFSAFVRTYNLHNPYYSVNGEYLTKTSNEIYSYFAFEPKKGIVIKTSLGYSIARNYRLYDIQDKVAFGLSAFRFGDNRKQLNSDFADGIIFRIDLIYRFYTSD